VLLLLLFLGIPGFLWEAERSWLKIA